MNAKVRDYDLRDLGLVQSQSAVGQEQLQLVSPYPSMGQRD